MRRAAMPLPYYSANAPRTPQLFPFFTPAPRPGRRGQAGGYLPPVNKSAGGAYRAAGDSGKEIGRPGAIFHDVHARALNRPAPGWRPTAGHSPVRRSGPPAFVIARPSADGRQAARHGEDAQSHNRSQDDEEPVAAPGTIHPLPHRHHGGLFLP